NLTVQDSYSYDGYGVMLGSAAGSANAAQTNLLYCGEQYDSTLSQYYLRARYYNPANGLFNQLDPYAGNMQDPQSLHKYLYCHANPVNGVDPSGMAGDFTLVGLMMTMTIITILASCPNIANAPGPNDDPFADSGGEIILDTGITLGMAVGGILVARFVIQPLRAAVSPYINGLLNQLRFRNATPIPTIQSPITNPSRLLPGPTQLELNQINGLSFEDAVRSSLRTTKGQSVVTSYGTVKPDFPVGNLYGVTDAKNVIKLSQSSQTRGFEEIARTQNMPFNLIISPRTETVSEPLKAAIYRTGGAIFEFNPTSGTFNNITFQGNKVVR
ncbi:RHS repeat-associated core domain-containing protein, partial [Anaerohalosphaeraceae bacterium U12dextr]